MLGEKDKKHGTPMTGLKKMSRVIEKAQLRFGDGRGRTDCICDVVRAMLVADDMATVAAIVRALRALIAEKVVRVVRIKDRFGSPSAGGWRDLMVNLCIVGDGVEHVCEIQVAAAL